MIRPCEQLRLLVQYVDNDGVSDSLIKGFSNVLALQFLLREYVQQEVSLSAVSWWPVFLHLPTRQTLLPEAIYAAMMVTTGALIGQLKP